MADKPVNATHPNPSASTLAIVAPPSSPAVVPPSAHVAAPPSNTLDEASLAQLLLLEPFFLFNEGDYVFDDDEDEDEDKPLPVPIPPPEINDGVPVDPSDDDDYLLQIGDKFLVCNNKIFDACPKVRRCPQCSVLIEHISNCRWMTCHCKFAFCFVCGTNTCIKTFHYEPCPNGYTKAL